MHTRAGMGATALKFALGIRDRYSMRPRWMTVGERVYVRSARSLVQPHYIAVRIGLILGRFVSELSATSAPPLQRIHVLERVKAKFAVTTAPPAAASNNQVTLASAWHTRHERLVIQTQPAFRTTALLRPTTPPVGGPAPAAVGVSMVVRHSASAGTRAGDATRPSPSADAVAGAAPSKGATQSAARSVAITAERTIPLSPHELRELTDHVVSALDRRLVSHRERMGSV